MFPLMYLLLKWVKSIIYIVHYLLEIIAFHFQPHAQAGKKVPYKVIAAHNLEEN